MNGKTLVGGGYGTAIPDRDFALLLDSAHARLPVDGLVTGWVDLGWGYEAYDETGASNPMSGRQ